MKILIEIWKLPYKTEDSHVTISVKLHYINLSIGGTSLKKIVIGILIVVLYCFPFAYFAMYQDFTNRSMIGYSVMIAAPFLFAFLVKYFCNSIPFIIGNILSLIISIYFNDKMVDTIEWYGGYFKPFYPSHLLVVMSLLNLIPQLLAMKLAYKVYHRVKD